MASAKTAVVTGTFLGAQVAKVFVDGVEQHAVQEVDPVVGYVVRGKTLPEGESTPDGFAAIGSRRYLFDRTKEEFVLERVEGAVAITWRDVERAKLDLAHKGVGLAAYGLVRAPA